MRDMGLRDANAYLDLLKEIHVVNDLDKSGEDRENEVSTVLLNMKNTTSDQASVNKKLNTASTVAWWPATKCCGKVWTDWMWKIKYSNMNNFWCGLHFIVWLSELANKTLSQYGNLISKGEKLGTVALPGGFGKAGK